MIMRSKNFPVHKCVMARKGSSSFLPVFGVFEPAVFDSRPVRPSRTACGPIMALPQKLNIVFALTLCIVATTFSSKIVLVVPPTTFGNQVKAAVEVAADQIYDALIISRSILPDPITIVTVTLTGSPQTDLDNVVAAAENCSLALVTSSQDILTATFTNRNVRNFSCCTFHTKTIGIQSKMFSKIGFLLPRY
jgi:hypothetical protein